MEIYICLTVAALGMIFALCALISINGIKRRIDSDRLGEEDIDHLWENIKNGMGAQNETAAYNAAAHRNELSQAARDIREENSGAMEKLRVGMSVSMDQFRRDMEGRMTALSDGSAKNITDLRNAVDTNIGTTRKELSDNFEALRDRVENNMKALADSMEARQKELSATVENRLSDITKANDQSTRDMRETMERVRADNARQLEEMRKTVDEKLQGTLEKRLGESFGIISERLEQVYKGLGEMQTLAVGVGDLKRVLTNVKTRGTWGEVQLGTLLEQILSPGQYAAQVNVVGLRERADFAVRLPGKGEEPVWLPIDAKFPQEDYIRLMDAYDSMDQAAAAESAKALEARVLTEAKSIHEKYVSPPATTDFAIMFLPTEGLYAEVIRRPGLFDRLQSEFRVMPAGPTTLAALLNSLQMGFRTLAIEAKSNEVWQVLGAVKKEFTNFGEVLTQTKNQLNTVLRTVDRAEVRTRAINRRLRDVEELPAEEAAALLPPDEEE